MDLMASNDFQALLKNYLDLEDMRRRFSAWQEDLDAYEDMIDLRRRYYEPLLPGIDKRFRVLDSRIRLRMEQRQSLDDRLQRLLVAPRPELLAPPTSALHGKNSIVWTHSTRATTVLPAWRPVVGWRGCAALSPGTSRPIMTVG